VRLRGQSRLNRGTQRQLKCERNLTMRVTTASGRVQMTNGIMVELGQVADGAVLDPESEDMYEVPRPPEIEVNVINFSGRAKRIKAWVHTDKGQHTVFDLSFKELIKIQEDKPLRLVVDNSEVLYG